MRLVAIVSAGALALALSAGGVTESTARVRGGIAVHRGAVVHHGAVVRRTGVVVVRPVRRWVKRPYYGRVVAGVTLGTLIVVTAGAVPVAPAANLCWYWADSSQTQGYWDYCR